MIKRIRLKNFQKHKRKEIKIKDRILTIVGPTDEGKSSIIRALSFLIENKKPFLGNQNSIVSITTEKGKVKRVKGKKNEYWLDDEVFVAFGKNVPDEIKQVINIPKEGIQNQFDPPFWVCLSPGQLAKELNKIVDLEIIDRSVKRINTKIKENKIEEQLEKAKYQEIKKELEDLKWFPLFSKQYKDLKDKGVRLSQLSETVVKIEGVVKRGVELLSKIDRLKSAILDGDKLKSITVEIEKTQKTIKKIGQLGKNCTKLQTKIKNKPDISKLKDIRGRADKVSKLKGNVEFVLTKLETYIKITDKQTKEIQELKEQSAKMKKECPTCGKEI